MDTISWIVFGAFVFFCVTSAIVEFTKPIPPADQNEANKGKKSEGNTDKK